MIFQLCKWHFHIDCYEFEKRWADVFQIYPNLIHFNPLQFCPSVCLLGFPVFCQSSSIVLNSYFDILVNSMTIWSVLKLPKITWPIVAPLNTYIYLIHGSVRVVFNWVWKVISKFLWFMISSLSDWFKVLAPLFQPIQWYQNQSWLARAHFPALCVGYV